MRIRYWFYLAVIILGFIAVGSSDLSLTIITGSIAMGLFIVTEVLERLAARYE